MCDNPRPNSIPRSGCLSSHAALIRKRCPGTDGLAKIEAPPLNERVLEKTSWSPIGLKTSPRMLEFSRRHEVPIQLKKIKERILRY